MRGWARTQTSSRPPLRSRCRWVGSSGAVFARVGACRGSRCAAVRCGTSSARWPPSPPPRGRARLRGAAQRRAVAPARPECVEPGERCRQPVAVAEPVPLVREAPRPGRRCTTAWLSEPSASRRGRRHRRGRRTARVAGCARPMAEGARRRAPAQLPEDDRPGRVVAAAAGEAAADQLAGRRVARRVQAGHRGGAVVADDPDAAGAAHRALEAAA